jgi:hypothetical protein
LNKGYKYVYLKARGNIKYCLPYETDLLYDVYLLRNSDKIASVIYELKSKIRM